MTSKCTGYQNFCRCPKCEARTQADPAYQQHLVLVRAMNNRAPQKIAEVFAQQWRDHETRQTWYEHHPLNLSGQT